MDIPNTNTEKDLLLRVAAGNEDSFRELCVLYSSLLFTTIFRFCDQRWLAEEIVQDTLLKVWLEKERLVEIDNFKGWLYTIASHLTINALKKIRNDQTKLEQWQQLIPAESLALPGTEKSDSFYRQLLADAVQRLPPKQQQTYRLIKEQQLKRTEVAAILQVSPETVKWNLEQAIRSIRAYCLSKINWVTVLIWIKINF